MVCVLFSTLSAVEPSVKHSSYVSQLKDRLSRLFFYSKKQKDEAGEKLQDLLVQKEQLVDERAQGVSPERLKEITKEIKVIDTDVYAQRVILGQKKSMKKRLAAFFGVVGVALFRIYSKMYSRKMFSIDEILKEDYDKRSFKFPVQKHFSKVQEEEID